jgi:acetyl-CoA synthetase
METISPTVKRWLHEAQADPEAFWARAAGGTHWFRSWDRTLDWNPPTFRWFVGGLTNLSYNCLDHHVQRGRGGHAALIALNERGASSPTRSC